MYVCVHVCVEREREDVIDKNYMKHALEAMWKNTTGMCNGIWECIDWDSLGKSLQ